MSSVNASDTEKIRQYYNRKLIGEELGREIKKPVRIDLVDTLAVAAGSFLGYFLNSLINPGVVIGSPVAEFIAESFIVTATVVIVEVTVGYIRQAIGKIRKHGE